MTPSYWFLYLIGVFLSAVGGLLLKIGSTSMDYNKNLNELIWQFAKNWKLLLGIICYVIPLLIWIFMLKKIELSFLQPLFSLIYVITPVLAIFFLNEYVSNMQWLGITFILLGVFVFAKG